MKKPNTIEDDLDKIRLQIHERTKDMTPAQYVEYIRKRAEPVIKKYGLKVVNRVAEANAAPRYAALGK